VYCATKFAVRALSQGMRIDLLGTPLRVTNVQPGMVETEFSLVRFHGDEARADKSTKGITPLTPDDIADAIVYCATRSPHVNIVEMLITPQAQVSTTMSYRKRSRLFGGRTLARVGQVANFVLSVGIVTDPARHIQFHPTRTLARGNILVCRWRR